MAGHQAQSSQQVVGDDDFNPRDRPWLLPYNRKLRHLQGITIRNLTLARAAHRPRGKTHDDEALPSTLKTPTKAVAQREAKRLNHSHSSSDLKPINESAPRPRADDEKVESGRPSPARPTAGRLRRRSTMEWSGASPLERQKKLEDVTAGRMADTFFSLHIPDREEPIYISEVVERAMNPNFRFFDLNCYGSAITRQSELTIKVWAKSGNMSKYQYLVELTLNLESLQYIGKGLETFRHPLPENCILFHLHDGVYTSFTDIPVANTPDPVPSTRATDTDTILPTSSYDALMRLSTLDDCIQDALATREKLTTEISSILTAHSAARSLVRRVAEAQDSLAATRTACATQRRRLDNALRKRDDLQRAIATRRTLIARGRAAQESDLRDLEAGRSTLAQRQTELDNLAAQTAGQRRRVCMDLSAIFPIEPIPNRPLLFTIRGLALPNSHFDDGADAPAEPVMAAAFGHVAQAVELLSVYLATPLPYPVTVRGSTSTIRDAVAMTAGPRSYPLFSRGVVRFRFEYGVFLLNKDIEVLASSLGARILDIRHTLANLKYVLYVATAGDGELPARKAGGVKGLLTHGNGRAVGQTGNAGGVEFGAKATNGEGSAAVSSRADELSVKANGIPYREAKSQRDAGNKWKSAGKDSAAYGTLQEALAMQMGRVADGT